MSVLADSGLVYRSSTMDAVVKLAMKVARSDASVLILGESGTGKGLLAESIYLHGVRRDRPFVTVSCANIPADLFESELFGHERGSHTDAHTRRIGRFEAADRGTMLLDGVESLTMGLQAKLLRVLQEKRFERLGGLETVQVDVRILSAATENLFEMVSNGGFREDLYYRLNVVQLRVPPLRERPEDVAPLAEHFLKTFRRKHGRGPRRFSQAARRLMRGYAWPGNVRELMNVVEATVIGSDSEIVEPGEIILGRDDPAARAVMEATLGGMSLAQLEARYIKEILKRTRGNRSRAAAILGISRKTLLAKIKNLEEDESPRGGRGN